MSASRPTIRLLQHSRVLRSSFHSYTHAPPPPPFSDTAQSILTSALTFVPEHGFTPAALTVGTRAAGYLDITDNLFPRGPFDMVAFYLWRERMALAGRVDFETPVATGKLSGNESLGLTEKVRRLIKARLRANVETGVIGRYQEALALSFHPPNIPAATKELAALSDEIWFLAGDTAVDTTWYTKRATLAAVYASTEIFMTQDKSPDYAATWEFLERRLQDVASLGRATSEVGNYIGYTAHAVVNILRSKSVIR